MTFFAGGLVYRRFEGVRRQPAEADGDQTSASRPPWPLPRRPAAASKISACASLHRADAQPADILGAEHHAFGHAQRNETRGRRNAAHPPRRRRVEPATPAADDHAPRLRAVPRVPQQTVEQDVGRIAVAIEVVPSIFRKDAAMQVDVCVETQDAW